MIDNLFERKTNITKYNEYLELIKNVKIPNNLTHLTKKKLLELMIDDYDEESLAFRFQLLKN